MTSTLLLVRHAESEWNRSSRYAGQRDIPLSDNGRLQAQRIAQWLHRERLCAIYSSPLQRARDTAGAIASQHRLNVNVDARLSEIDHGLWQDLTVEQVQTQYPTDYARWRTAPHQMRMPRGECLSDVALRASRAQSEIISKYPNGHVVICSHDAVLRVMLLQSLGLGLEHFWKWRLANASISILAADGDADSYAYQLVRLNETAHLEGIESPLILQAL